MFTMQIGEEEHLKLGNASAEQIGYAQDIAKFDITLSVTEHAGKQTHDERAILYRFVPGREHQADGRKV